MTIGSLDDATIAGDDRGNRPRWQRGVRSLHTLWDHDHSPMGTAVRATLQATADITPAVDGDGQQRVVRRLAARQGPGRGGPDHPRATSAPR